MPRRALDGRRRRALTCETMAAESSGVEETDAFERNHHTARPGAGGRRRRPGRHGAGRGALAGGGARRAAAGRGDDRPVRPLRRRRQPAALLGRRSGDRDVQRARRRRRPPRAGGDGRQPEPHRDRHQRGGAPARAGAGGGGDRHLLLRPRGAAGAALRAGAEDHVDHQRHLDRGAQGQELPLRVPPDGPFRPVRRRLRLAHPRARAGQARHGAGQGEARRHLRGRALRHRRRRGDREQRQGAQHADRAQGGVFGERAGPLDAGHQAAPRAAGRGLPGGLQPGHHACSCARPSRAACASA